MEFNKMCEYVDNRLNLLSLEQKITVFHDILNCPVKHTFCKYYYQDQEWDEFKMKDELKELKEFQRKRQSEGNAI